MLVNKKYLGFFFFFILGSYAGFSQTAINPSQLNGTDDKQPNPVETAVPFLTIAPDSRAGAMGDVGVATSPDINSMHWNPAKYAQIENEGGLSISYSPWLRNLVGDIDLAYLSGYKRIDRQQVVAASLLYFSLGEIPFTDNNGEPLKNGKPNEFAIDAAYTRLFGEHISGGIAFRFIHSDLSNGLIVENVQTKAGNAFAADISTYYKKKITIADKESSMAFGLNISNIGTKISYTDELNKDFLPTNLRLGTSFTVKLDDYNSLALNADINKLLVPTRPRYGNGDTIIAGMDPNVPVVKGIFQSFYDAPGGFKEELEEITYGIGSEYWYRNQFAIRGGYFHENQYKGNRKFFSVGVGLKLNVLGLDFSYLIPTYANHPLANTLRFSISFDFDAFRKLKRQ